MDHLRLLTLNVWNRSGPWASRRVAIERGLADEQADVVALQEVLDLKNGGLSQLAELGDGLYPHRAYAPAWTIDAASGFSMGNAVLSKLPIVEQAQVLLPNPMQHETRSLLYVLLATAHGQLPLFVTHLDWQLDLSAVRCAQVAFIVDRIGDWVARAGQRPGADLLPPLLAGDFNAEPDSDEIRFLCGRHALPTGDALALGRGACFYDCFRYCGGRERDGATFARNNPFAAAEGEPDRRIDYIFAGRPDRQRRGQPLRAWRCFDQPVEGCFASDHYGVAAEIQLAARAKPLF
jgi:endonuclease/exonuclease/phosphatase family metal-dependent hydrolase